MLANYNDIILASGSPRRKELLSMLDIQFRVDTSRSIDETIDKSEITNADDIPVCLSRKKAVPFKRDMQQGRLVITADTVVILGNDVIGKPQDAEDARRILQNLSGKTHRVVTGVTLLSETREISFSETTEVEFSELTQEEINYYVNKYHPLDKAGAYGIQEWIGGVAVKALRGSYYNVMGLPINKLYHCLKDGFETTSI